MKRLSKAWRWQGLLVAGSIVAASTMPGAVTQKFYPDDPLRRDPEDQDAAHVTPNDITHSYGAWQMIRGGWDHMWRRAMNVNSMDEVPDSSWFTNRLGFRTLSIADIARGPDRSGSPAPGRLTVIAGKSNGVTPGFQMTDGTGHKYFVKFDPPSNPEMSSAAEVISTKILHAIGYYVPENYIAAICREDLMVGPGAKLRQADDKRRPLTERDIDQLLGTAARGPDGCYRAMASLALEGAPLGPFEYQGTRRDDPNDIVPHEHRRELRGLRVFAAWLNHVDTKAENSLDTLLHVGPRTIVRHNLLDFGSTLGSAGVAPLEWRDGHEYVFDKRSILLALVTLGLYVPPWQRAHDLDLPSVGRVEAAHFRPEQWKPTLPNPAFENARADDTFWAAQRVMMFSDEAIRAIVKTGQLSDSRATAYLTDMLIRRRDRIGRTWLTSVNPIVRPSIDRSGMLSFGNAATDAGVATAPAEYWIHWASYDNSTGTATSIGSRIGRTRPDCPLPANISPATHYLMAEIAAFHPVYPSWAKPVRTFFRRNPDGTWTTVGLERIPDEAASLSGAH